MIMTTTSILMRSTIIKVADKDETMTTIIEIISTIMIMMTSTDFNGNMIRITKTMITTTRM